MALGAAAACGCVISPIAGYGNALSQCPAASTSSPSPALVSPKNPPNSLSSRRGTNGRGWELLRLRTWDGSTTGVVGRAPARGDDKNSRDDAGVIKDMELYLEDLSLEYDSVWDTKPAWCQPWTIVGTGVGAISASWLPFHDGFLTGGVTFVIGLWWFGFLYAYPLGYAEMIAERRKMVENGREDIYGRKTDE